MFKKYLNEALWVFWGGSIGTVLMDQIIASFKQVQKISFLSKIIFSLGRKHFLGDNFLVRIHQDGPLQTTFTPILKVRNIINFSSLLPMRK